MGGRTYERLRPHHRHSLSLKATGTEIGLAKRYFHQEELGENAEQELHRSSAKRLNVPVRAARGR
jgi:hypothetical protein